MSVHRSSPSSPVLVVAEFNTARGTSGGWFDPNDELDCSSFFNFRFFNHLLACFDDHEGRGNFGKREACMTKSERKAVSDTMRTAMQASASCQKFPHVTSILPALLSKPDI